MGGRRKRRKRKRRHHLFSHTRTNRFNLFSFHSWALICIFPLGQIPVESRKHGTASGPHTGRGEEEEVSGEETKLTQKVQFGTLVSEQKGYLARCSEITNRLCCNGDMFIPEYNSWYCICHRTQGCQQKSIFDSSVLISCIVTLRPQRKFVKTVVPN